MKNIIALILDLANIAGGLLLAQETIIQLFKLGAKNPIRAIAESLQPLKIYIGLAALGTGLYWLLFHIFKGQSIWLFEIIGIVMGLILANNKINEKAGRELITQQHLDKVQPFYGIFGLIAIAAGIYGLILPNG